MYPWFWFWAPQIHLPFSGSVAQEIAPDTDWFFDSIRPEAGNGDVEKKVFEVASYGRQLGLITEVLLSLADGETVGKEKAVQSLERLKQIQREVEDVKRTNTSRTADAAIKLLRKLRDSDRLELERVLAVFDAETRGVALNRLEAQIGHGLEGES